MSIFGSDPFGTTPFASWAGDDGTVYTIGTTTVVFQGFAPAITGPNPMRVTQLFRETLLGPPKPPVRVVQLFREALVAAPIPPVRITQLFRETLYYRSSPPVKITQLVREVLRSGTSLAPDDGGFITILW